MDSEDETGHRVDRGHDGEDRGHTGNRADNDGSNDGSESDDSDVDDRDQNSVIDVDVNDGSVDHGKQLVLLGHHTMYTHICQREGDDVAKEASTVDEEVTDEDDEDDSNLSIPFDIPIEDVNHTLKFRLDIKWDDFRWDVARKLHVFPDEFELSYKLASQPKGDMARALVDEQGFTDLVKRSRPFVNGTKACGRGKEFSVQLFPKITASKSGASGDGNTKSIPAKTRKVCLHF